MTDIRIDRLALRVRGVPVETASALADGLGAAVARALADGPAPAPGTGPPRDLQLGRIAARRDASAGELRAAAARHVADAIRERGAVR